MTVLSAAQSAMVRLVSKKPTTLFSSVAPMETELADLVTDVGVDIMKSHDWRALTKVATITGDGIASSFPLPSDYDRMVQAQGIHDGKNWLWGYSMAPDLDQWIDLTSGSFSGPSPGWWIMLGGSLQFSPLPGTGALAKYPYISNFIGLQGSTPISVFSQDTDTFQLDERLLTLGLIWRWKAQKGMEYAEDLATYEMALSQEQARDKGAAVISGWSGGRTRLNTRPAWPWTLG